MSVTTFFLYVTKDSGGMMPIYVDELRNYKSGAWCHMMTDGDVSELHDMAEKIGLRRRWFQNHPDHPHYDLRKSIRDHAIRLGAIPVSSVELVHMAREKRRKDNTDKTAEE